MFLYEIKISEPANTQRPMAAGKANVSGVSQGHQRLWARIDWSYVVEVPRPHLDVCRYVLEMKMAALGVILSPFPKEEGEMCHACYPSRH